jgi:hypothetical protein
MVKLSTAATVGRALVTLSGWALTACAGGDSGSSEGPAAGECKTYVSTWCGRASACRVQLGRLGSDAEAQAARQDCVEVADSGRCSKAESVGPTYQECLDAIAAKPCSDWDVPNEALGGVLPPGSCADAIRISE